MDFNPKDEEQMAGTAMIMQAAEDEVRPPVSARACTAEECAMMGFPEYCHTCGDYTLYPRPDNSDIYDCSECGQALEKCVTWLPVEEKPA